MIDYAQARKNMVDCQIYPSGVIHAGLLNAFETIPREIFVPDDKKGISYYDEDVQLGQGRSILAPLTLSKMLEAAELKENDVVLDIGGATGYSAAIMSANVSTIIALESDEKYLKQAEVNWNKLETCNIISCKGTLKNGYPEKEPYNLIILHGAVPEIPINIASQLAEDGRLLTIIRKPGERMGQATIVRNNATDKSLGFSTYPLFECGADYLKGFEPKPEFQF